MRRVVALFVLLAACSGDADLPVAKPETSTPTPAAVVTTVPVTTWTPASSSTTPSTVAPEPDTATPGTSSSMTGASTPTAPPADDWFLVSVTGSLPDGFAVDLREVPGVSVVSEVWVGNAGAAETRTASGEVIDEARPGFVLPLELQAFDPAAHTDFVPPDVAEALTDLGPDEVLLGSSSARFRGLEPGATITLQDGEVLAVAGVVADEWVGFAELVTTLPDAVSLGADRPRYAVVRFDGDVSDLQSAAAAVTERSVRVGARSDVPVFRHADAVAPQILVKERFGEFSYRPLRGGRVEIDTDWVDANIVTIDLPLMGAVRCHRDFAELLRQVMEELVAGGNGSIVTPGSETGCYKPRFVAGRRDLSRHAWGIAADINWGNDPDGPRSPVAPPLLEAMASVGITSGHAWTDPDPGHFEWIGDMNGCREPEA